MEFTRILGVYFNNNYEPTNYFKIQEYIHQMKECQRNLPLKAKL